MRAVTPTWTTHIRVASADAAAAAVEVAGGKVLMEPFDVAPAGRTALLADPTGASFAVWQPKQRRGATLVNEAGAWALSSLITNELKVSEGFYGAVFRLKTQAFGDSQLRIFSTPPLFRWRAKPASAS